VTDKRRARGRAFEFWVRDLLIEKGYHVHVCGRKARFIAPGKMITEGDDIFGADIIAMRWDQPVIFIQATSDSSVKKRLDAFLSFNFPLIITRCELWQKREDGRVQVKVVIGDRFVDWGYWKNREFVKEFKDGAETYWNNVTTPDRKG